MLKITNLSKTYGKGDKGVRALDCVSLEVRAGEIFGFIGHNGAGKTTAIKSLTGVIPFDEGTVELDGISILKEPVAYKSQIAYIPDSPDLYESMTGIGFINFICDVFGVGEKEREERIKKYADAFELTKDLAARISSYSHGMKQKLAIISALCHAPKLLVLDEPFIGLDPKASHTLKTLMREVCDGGGAIFFSTHILEVAEKLCDRVAIIKSGRILKMGAMDEVIGDASLEELFLSLTAGEEERGERREES